MNALSTGCVLHTGRELTFRREIVRQRDRAAKVRHQELDEAEDHEGLVSFAQHREDDGHVCPMQAEPGLPRVYGHHQEDAHRVIPQARLPRVLQMAPDGQRRDHGGQDEKNGRHDLGPVVDPHALKPSERGGGGHPLPGKLGWVGWRG